MAVMYYDVQRGSEIDNRIALGQFTRVPLGSSTMSEPKIAKNKRDRRFPVIGLEGVRKRVSYSPTDFAQVEYSVLAILCY